MLDSLAACYCPAEGVGLPLAVQTVMPVRAKCCYTHLTRTNCAWREHDHSIKKFVDALKGRPIHGYAHLRVRTDAPLRQLEQANAGEAFDWFGEMAAELIADEDLVRPVFVPLPNSRCSVGSVEPPRTFRLAAAVQRYCGGGIADVVRFDRPSLSAHAEGGTRDATEIFSRLRLVGHIEPGRPYVITDDVLATGGHVRAVAAFLQSHGADVKLAVCAVAVELEPAADPFERVTRELADVALPLFRRGCADPVVNLVLEPGDRVA